MSHDVYSIPLREIIDRVRPMSVLGDPSGIPVTGVSFRDGDVQRDHLYCCIPGRAFDGHSFAVRAARVGAVAFICEHSLPGLPPGTVQLVVGPGEARAAMARAACAFYGDPASALQTVAVTGTNGKTTTTFLLRSIFEHHGWPAGVLGTLDGARTTPESPDLQGFLADFRRHGVVAAALEVTSHALVQSRVEGICFDVAIFTNLSQDHLDFHETMEQYFAAKALLFEPERARIAVVNTDDPYGRRLAERALIETVTYSMSDAKNLDLAPTSSTFSLGSRRIRLGIGGAFNVANALAAAGAARMLGIGDDEIAAGLEAARGVPGRFETIESIDGVTVVVDYAHTPAALELLLNAVRRALSPSLHAQRHGENGTDASPRVFLVFGAGGNRDRGKRPAMGSIASRIADVVVVTADNPRDEDPYLIAEEIVAGMRGAAYRKVELDRRAAISWALSRARPGDVVVVAGKGHETTQQFAGVEVHFDDREVVLQELARQGRSQASWPELRAGGAGQ